MTLPPRATNGEITERMRPQKPMPVSVRPSTATSAARISGSSHAPRQPVHDRDLVGGVLAIQVADEDRRAEAEDGDPRQQQDEPALEVHARVQPARAGAVPSSLELPVEDVDRCLRQLR